MWQQGTLDELVTWPQQTFETLMSMWDDSAPEDFRQELQAQALERCEQAGDLLIGSGNPVTGELRFFGERLGLNFGGGDKSEYASREIKKILAAAGQLPDDEPEAGARTPDAVLRLRVWKKAVIVRAEQVKSLLDETTNKKLQKHINTYTGSESNPAAEVCAC